MLWALLLKKNSAKGSTNSTNFIILFIDNMCIADTFKPNRALCVLSVRHSCWHRSRPSARLLAQQGCRGIVEGDQAASAPTTSPPPPSSAGQAARRLADVAACEAVESNALGAGSLCRRHQHGGAGGADHGRAHGAPPRQDCHPHDVFHW